MLTKAKILVTALGVLILSIQAFGWEPLDKIVAVIGDRVILASELQFQLEMYQAQAAGQLRTKEQKDEFKKELLQQMINDRLILIKAKEDTSIVVTESDIDQALEDRLSELRNRFGSQQEFENQVAAEGYTMRDLRMKLRADISDQLVKERLVQKMLVKVSVSREEVEAFYKQYADSIPPHPQSVKLAHLLLKLDTSPELSDSIRLRAESIRQMIVDGKDFEEIAKQYSEDPSAESGGDIGTFRKGDLVPEYEQAALALNPGEISPVVHSPFGYHIIKLVAKSGDTYQSKHVLLMEKASGSDSSRTVARADSLINRINSGEDWGTIVKDYSTDDQTRANFGELGWYPIEQIPQEFSSDVTSLKEGQVSKPIWSGDGLHIVKLLERREKRPVTLGEDYDMLKEYARRQKSSQVIAQVVDEMKDRVYMDVRGI